MELSSGLPKTNPASGREEEEEEDDDDDDDENDERKKGLKLFKMFLLLTRQKYIQSSAVSCSLQVKKVGTLKLMFFINIIRLALILA